MKVLNLSKKNHRLFVTFEGGEGAGKTTLIRHLHNHLTKEGILALQTFEPGATPFGELISDLVLHGKVDFGKKSELFLFLADRAEHVEKEILPHLEKNYTVLCDRYNDSTLAYQGAARSLDRSILKTLCQFASSNLNPDLTFFLDLDPKVGLERSRTSRKIKRLSGRIENEKIEFHTKVREAFLQLAKEETNRFCILDASMSFEEVFKSALATIEAKLGAEC